MADEPAEKSYRGRAVLAVGVVFAAGLISAGVYFAAHYRAELGQRPHPAAPAAVALSAPTPVPPLVPLPNRPHDPVPAAPDDSSVAISAFPEQPVDPPPTALSNWSGALIIPQPSINQPNTAASPTTPALHLVRPEPGVLPTGTPLHLRIVYTPSDRADGSRIDALTDRLRSEVRDIATETLSPGPAAEERVVYFFPNDRAGASRIAASLARLTKRAVPVVLGHATLLPRPGTVEIRLPLKDGKV